MSVNLVLKHMKSFCLNDRSLITNLHVDSDIICFALFNAVNNSNELDSLKCGRRILVNDVKFKLGFGTRYTLSACSGEILFNTVSKILYIL